MLLFNHPQTSDKNVTANMLCGAADALLFAFFRKHSQALHLAVSCDGLVWDALNADPAAYGGDKPVLRSALGRCSIRDPFLGRDHRGGFVLVATNGEAAVREILVYRSRDLLRWDGGRLLDVKLPAARRTWAPQYSWIEERGAFLVYWSSSTRESRGAFAIYAAYTADFSSLGEPFRLFDPGHSVRAHSTLHLQTPSFSLDTQIDDH